MNGLNKAEAEINADGKKIELIYEDHKNDPKEAVTGFKKLSEFDKVDLIITTMSGTSAAIVPLAKEIDMPIIATVVYINIPSQYDESVQIYIQPEDEADALIEVSKKLNIKKLGILYLQNDYGIAIKEEIERSGNFEVVSEGYHDSDSTFQTQLLKLKESEVDTIYMITFPHTVGTMIKEAKNLEFDGNIISNAPIYLNGMIGTNEIFEKTYTSVPESYLIKNKYPAGNEYIPYEVLKLVGKEIERGNKYNIIESISNLGLVATENIGIIKIDDKTKTARIPLTIAKIENGSLVVLN